MISNATEIGAVWEVVIGGSDDDEDEKQMTEFDEGSKRWDKSGRPSLNFIVRSRFDRGVCMPKTHI